MNNLQKFNHTLENLDQEVERLQSAANIFEKFQNLIQEYQNVNENLKENNTVLLNIGTSQKEEHIKIKELVEFSKAEQEKLRNQLTEYLKQIAGEITANHTILAKNIDEKIENIISKNKVFYQDFESTLRIKLDETKTEVKLLIESERLQIKDIIETELLKVEKELRNRIEIQTQAIIIENEKNKSKILQVLGVLGVLLLIILISIFMLYK